MSETVVFSQLSRKFIDENDATPAAAQQVVYYSLAIGHHLGVIDCLEAALSCPWADYLAWIATLEEGSTARRKMEGVPKYGEIVIDANHIAMLANVCPNGAIKREKGFVHVMQERCIGCKTCVVACPYGAMEVVVRPVVRNSGIGLSVRAEKAEANKCDLCYHRDAGPACMEACPTHALVCVDRDKLEQMSAEKRRRAAFDTSSSLLF
mgnify:FL=1